jgi:prepilin signal peptidase PulO-like enzyme (type II secretory pathway)
VADAPFEQDLRRWVDRVYERRSGMLARRRERRVMQILDAERRWLIPLSVGVLLGVALMPVLGAPGVLGSLALLYVGAVASGYRTMRRAERVERALDLEADARVGAERAWATCPPLGDDEHARLVRIMNLAGSATFPGAQAMLLGELKDAASSRPLAGWQFLGDLQELLRSDCAALA